MLLLHFQNLFQMRSTLQGWWPGRAPVVKSSLRPKTKRCYELLFRNFVAFCICVNKSVHDINLGVTLAYLAENNVSVHMVANNISAIRASLIMYGLDYLYLDHPRVRYFVKSLKTSILTHAFISRRIN